MTTHSSFEQDLGAAMRAYLVDAPIDIDADALVRGFATAYPRRRPLVTLPVRLFGWRPGWIMLVVLLALAALVVALAGGLSPAPAPIPTPSATPSATPDAGRALLAFARGSDIYLADEQSGRSIKPAGTTGLSLDTWSPDGRFLSLGTPKGEVLLLDVATMQVVAAPVPSVAANPATEAPLPTLPVGPTAALVPTASPGSVPSGAAPFGYRAAGWLSFGRSIILHAMGTSHTFAVDIETGATVELPSVALCHPVLSPDARYMAGISFDALSVAVVDLRTGARDVVSDFAGDSCPMGFGNDTPSWSPDGSRLTVVGATSLRVVKRDGGAASDIVSLDFRPADPSAVSVRPLWSPGGKWIAFHGPEGLEVIRPDGTQRRLLVAGHIDDVLYRWTPDSTRIDYGLFVGDAHPDGFVLWSVGVETGETHMIQVAQPYVEAFARQPITDATPLVTLP